MLFSLMCLSALFGACMPNRVVIDLAPGDGELLERQVFADAEAGFRGSKVVLLDVSGLITFQSPGLVIASHGNIVDDVVARLDKARNDNLVRAVILRVNSPGGSVAATETLYGEIERFRAETGKPVVVSMAEVAASGGYYIALAADRIIAQESSITGSIGVIIQTVNFSRGMAMIGIEARALTSGPNKDIANPLEPPSEAHYHLLQGLVEDFYLGFRDRLRQRRPTLAPGWETDVADGRIFTGRQALAARLVDANGDLYDAFKAAKALANIESARLVKYHGEGREPASAYAGATAPSAGATNGIGVNINLAESALPRAGFYYLWVPAIP